MSVRPIQRKFQLKATKKKSLLVFPTVVVPLFFFSLFLHARISVASSSGHQTAEMGAVTLHSGLGNPTFTAASQRTAEGSATTQTHQETLPSLVTPTHTHLDNIYLPKKQNKKNKNATFTILLLCSFKELKSNVP